MCQMFPEVAHLTNKTQVHNIRLPVLKRSVHSFVHSFIHVSKMGICLVKISLRFIKLNNHCIPMSKHNVRELPCLTSRMHIPEKKGTAPNAPAYWYETVLEQVAGFLPFFFFLEQLCGGTFLLCHDEARELQNLPRSPSSPPIPPFFSTFFFFFFTPGLTKDWL